MRAPSLKGLLIRSAGEAPLRLDTQRELSVLGAKMSLEPLFKNTGPIADLGLGESPQWYLAQAPPALVDANPWDVAHQAVGEALGLAAGPEGVYIEPDLEQQFLAFPQEPEALAAAGHVGEQDPQDPKFPRGPGFAWFLKPDFSQLAAARQAGGANVRIAHVDTGYDPAHGTRPQNLLSEFEYDFVDDDRDAHDPGEDGLLKNPGHGTGTLSILAGNRVQDLSNDFLGGAPLAEIIPVRIATSVILLRTNALAKALDYVIAPSKKSGEKLGPVNVVTLSMGGLASGAWADAVNRAYEAGICIVAAAGNNISAGLFPFPTRFIVYPARFRRVIAACGVMANRAPYYGLGVGKMQGNFGPQSKMATAMAAYTPNMPWAEIGYPAIVDMNGAGTSSATPQIAATAALWIEKYRNELFHYPKPWQRVEAVRHALFSSADKSADGGSNEKLGNGILHAEAALQIQPPAQVTQTPRDSAAFSFLRVLTGLGVREEPARTQMFALEITQLAQQWDKDRGANPFDSILPDPDLPHAAMSPPKVREFLEAMIEHPRASSALREHLKFALGVTPPRRPPGGPGKAPLAKGEAPQAVPAAIPQPIYRRLRGYAFDPSLKLQLDTEPISEITFQVPWENLEPGPRGEYLDVVDIDPASKCFYEPVNLDHPHLLAQDGLAASEGTPQFHQQMAYVVASLAIQNFEHALGRKALWAPGPSPDPKNPFDDSYYIPRLRIYPHAMREANAYYSPAKKALLFGYFMASADDPGDHLPGGLVFTCLSHDIVAHETSHALLDGMHRRFTLPTNPDVRGFHEAFADIVALLQHFTFPEILRHQIARTRGEIRSQENLLGQLAGQFGRASGARGALRDAIGRYNPGTQSWEPRKPDPLEYERTTEAHARGAILVAAVFDAFLSIYETRVADLLRLATGGTGILAPGAIHPDLVRRLSEEAAKAAKHVLTMCIRALDYCPPVDLTFGEYLRALITADYDLVRDDDLNYRVAFVEAFRKRGLYPRDVRTLSVESLLWRGVHSDAAGPSQELRRGIANLRHHADALQYVKSRSTIFFLAREMRREVHAWLDAHFDGPCGRRDADYLGLEADKPFEVHAARLSNRVGPDGQKLLQFVIELLQQRTEPVDPREPDQTMTFEGGCTLVADLQDLEIKYCIRKHARSDQRLARQQEFVQQLGQDSLRSTYFEDDNREPFALLHRI